MHAFNGVMSEVGTQSGNTGSRHQVFFRCPVSQPSSSLASLGETFKTYTNVGVLPQTD